MRSYQLKPSKLKPYMANACALNHHRSIPNRNSSLSSIMSTGSRRDSSLPYPNDHHQVYNYLPDHPPPRQAYGSAYNVVHANREERIRATDTMFPYSFPYPASSNTRNIESSTSRWSPSALGSSSSVRGTSSYSPLRILILDHLARDANQRPRRIIPDAPQRFIGPSLTRVPTDDESINLVHEEEQMDVLKKLKKEIYNPTPKKIIQRLNLYYRENSRNKSSIADKVKDDEDDKRCAVCLEDFEPKEVVMLTPCSHMFHEDCIVPWVKSSGKCPVCRFAICERISERRRLQANNSAVDWTENDPFTGALISFIRAVDDEPRGESTYRGPNSPLWF